MTIPSAFPTAAKIQALIDQAYPGGSVAVRSAMHEKAFPKRDRVDLYRVELSRSGRDLNALLAVHRLPRERRAKALSKLAKAARRLEERYACDVPPLYGEAPDAGALLYTFPLDPKLERLPDAVSPRFVAARLSTEDEVGVEVIRYVPARRCQLQWSYQAGDIYTKLYQDDRGKQVFAAMQWLHRHIAASGDPRVSTPAPLAYWDDWNALAQRAAPGDTLYALGGSGGCPAEAFASAGRTLALVHGAGDPGSIIQKVHTPLAEIEVVAHWIRLAAQTQPHFAEMQDCIDRLARKADVACRSITAVHRDCYDRQFLIHGDCAAIIDFDDVSLGEPELDLGNFLSHIELRAMQGLFPRSREQRFRSAFLKTYSDERGAGPSPARIAFYLATSLMRLAALYSMRPGEESVAGQLLDRARAAVRSAS